MSNGVDELGDLELLLIDPAKNRFRLYAITACRTLFGEQCLRIVWGRIGNRRLQERSEMFVDQAAMVRRRNELVGRRRRHGYATRVLSPAGASAVRRSRAPASAGPRAQSGFIDGAGCAGVT